MPSQCTQAAAVAEQKDKASEGTAQNTQHHYALAKPCQYKMNKDHKFAIISILPRQACSERYIYTDDC